jgi:hypothetical protein
VYLVLDIRLGRKESRPASRTGTTFDAEVLNLMNITHDESWDQTRGGSGSQPMNNGMDASD